MTSSLSVNVIELLPIIPEVASLIFLLMVFASSVAFTRMDAILGTDMLGEKTWSLGPALR